MEILNLDKKNYKKAAEGEKIFAAGEPARDIYLILQGEVGLYPDFAEQQRENALDRIDSGKILGEMALLSEAERNFSAVCLRETIYVSLSPEDFTRFLQKKPEFNEKTIMALSRRLDKLSRIFIKTGKETYQQEVNSSDAESIDKRTDNQVQEEAANTGNEINKVEDEGVSRNKDESVHEGEDELKQKPNRQGQLYLAGHGNYSQTAPKEFQYYTYEKKIECPVCGNKFAAVKIRNSRLSLQELRNDLRKIFKNFKPAWYYIWVCSECYYAAPRQEFSGLAQGHEEKIENEFQEFVEEKAGGKLNPGFSSPRHLSEVFLAYYLSLALFEFIPVEHNKPAGCWLRLSWLYEDLGEESLQKTAAVKAMENLKKYYYEEYSGQLTGNAEHKLTLLLASLMIDHGEDPREALPLLDELIRDGTIKKVYRDLARDKFAELRDR